MWINEIIARSGLLNPEKGEDTFLTKRLSQTKKSRLPGYDLGFLKNKKVVITGDFFPASEDTFRKRLIAAKASVMTNLTTDTEILICGKFPDWTLIEDAQKKSLEIIYIDKVSDLFLKWEATGMQPMKKKEEDFPVPLGV